MQITDDDIRRFQEIWREEFEEEITATEASHHIARLDALYLLLYGPRHIQDKALVEQEVEKHQ